MALVFLLSAISTARAQDGLRAWSGPAKPSFRLDLVGTGTQRSPQNYSGEIVLLHFWATYCEPCRAELPALQRLAARGAAHRLRVLTISVAEVDPRVQRFLDTNQLDLSVLMDRDRAVTKAWKVEALPTTYVLDRSGRPRLFIEQDYDWDQVDPAVLAARLDQRPRKSTSATQSMKPGG